MAVQQSRIHPGSLSLARPNSLFAALGLLVATTLLAGCAPVHPTKLPEATHEPAPSVQPEAVIPSDEGKSVETPPISIPEPTPDPSVTRVLMVKSSAYNSHSGQTDVTPNIAAWGDRLEPGMKVVAVSKDLIELGLRRGQRLTIEGLEGEYVVLDRMPSRWHQKIDIYMGEDVRAALNWGVREVEIRWHPDVHDVEGGGLDSTGTVEAD